MRDRRATPRTSTDVARDAAVAADGPVVRRAHDWAQRRSARLRGYNPWDVTVDAVRRSHAHRITGFAAEIAFFASLALVPFTAALGGMLGWIRRWAGASGVAEAEAAAVGLMGTVLGPELVDDVAAPFVRAQLSEAQSGIALGGLVVALWLGSRVFLPAVQALDLAFDAVEDRSVLRQRLIALAVAVSSLVVMNLQLLLLVFGPLLGGGREIAARFGLGPAFRVLWEAGRWPVVALVITTFLVTIYRFVPRRRLGWRQSLPGAVVATASWLVIAVGFRVYLAAGATPGRGLRVEAEALVVAGRAVGALVATVLWVFLSSIAVLFGGEINAAIARRRDARPPSDAPAGGAQATDDAQRPD